MVGRATITVLYIAMYAPRMARMIRKQVYIAPEQERTLKRLAKQRGVTEAELIRDGIDHIAVAPHRPTDRSAWQREERFIREKRMFDVPQTGRGWTREDIYEERLGRYGPPPR